MRTTPNASLTVWDLPNDDYSPTQLAANWDAVDAKLATVVAPGSEIVYQAISSDTTTTNTVNPGVTLFAFPAATYTAAKHYIQIVIPRLSHSIASGTVRFRLRESTTDIAGLMGTQCSSTAGNMVDVNIIAPFTPSAGTHSYTLTWYTTTAGTLTIGTTGFSPAILRIIKA